MNATSYPNWDDWFHSLLREFKRRYFELSPEVKAELATRSAQAADQEHPVFVSPTQLLVVWLKDEALNKDIQFLLMTRFSDMPDGQVTVVGPFPPDQYLNQTKIVLTNPCWDKPWHDKSFREFIEDRFVEISQYFAEHLKPGPSRIGAWPGSSWGDFGIYWNCFADIRQHQQTKLINDLVTNMIPSLQKGAPQTIRQEATAFGSYLNDPVWIDSVPKPSYQQRLQGYTLPPGFANRSWEQTVNGKRVIVWRDGLFAVEAQRQDDALTILNAVMAVGSLLGLETIAVNTHDLVNLGLDLGTTNVIRSGTALYTRTNQMIQARWNPIGPAVQQHGVLSASDLSRLLFKTDQILRQADLRELLHLYLYSNTFMKQSHEYTASFVFGWTIIERFLHNQITNLSVSARRKIKIDERWPIDTIIEVLNLLSLVDEEHYRIYMMLKDIRNDIVHSANLVTKTQAEACLREALTVMRIMCGIRVSDEIVLAKVL